MRNPSELQGTEPTAEDRVLLDAARDIRARAYAPYSGFFVGAAVRTTEGAVYVGTNMENASFPVGVCAEVVALAAANTAGDRGLESIAIVAEGDTPAFPCGACRQAINEFNPDARVVVAGHTGKGRVVSIRELLPGAFVPSDLLDSAPGREG